VRDRATDAGITKVMSPHRVRHSAITTALDVTGGDVQRVQKLSRHANLNTLIIYDDNRMNAQGEVTDLLDGLM
jgi:integrase/recombinase XerC